MRFSQSKIQFALSKMRFLLVKIKMFVRPLNFLLVKLIFPQREFAFLFKKSSTFLVFVSLEKNRVQGIKTHSF